MFPLKARVLILGLVLALAAGIAGIAVCCGRGGPPSASVSASPPPFPPGARGCAALPHACGFPDATNSGVPAGTVLKTVPGQVSSGPGWSYNTAGQYVSVNGNGAVLSGLSITANVNITATNVTLNDDQIVTGGTFGVSLRHAAGATIENTTVSGQNATSGRVNYAIDDIYGDSAGLVVKNDNIADWRIGVNASTGQVTGNYIHDPGFIAGDHTDGVYNSGGTQQLTISGNTIFNSIGQACAIMLESVAGQAEGNKTITGNFLAGGTYTIYAAGAQNNSTNINFQGNRFGQQYYPTSGQYGPVAQFQNGGAGNTWTDNIWDNTGNPVSP